MPKRSSLSADTQITLLLSCGFAINLLQAYVGSHTDHGAHAKYSSSFRGGALGTDPKRTAPKILLLHPKELEHEQHGHTV